MMTEKEPVAESIATNGVATVTSWADARRVLSEAHTYWLATVRPDGHPHVMPVFAVWLDGTLYTTANETTRKANNLTRNSSCVVTVTGDGMDLVLEGEAVKIRDKATLQRVADAYAAKYEWHLTPRDGAYHADYGAPSAGPPPYELYEVTPTTAFGLNTTEPYGATRWRF